MFVVRKEFLVLGNRTSAWVPYEGIKGVKAQRCCVRLRSSLMTNIQQWISPIERRQTRHEARIITVLRLVWVFHYRLLTSIYGKLQYAPRSIFNGQSRKPNRCNCWPKRPQRFLSWRAGWMRRTDRLSVFSWLSRLKSRGAAWLPVPRRTLGGCWGRSDYWI